MSAGAGILPEATNPKEMSPAVIAVYSSTHLEALPMPAIQSIIIRLQNCTPAAIMLGGTVTTAARQSLT